MKGVSGCRDMTNESAFEPLAVWPQRKTFALRLSEIVNVLEVDDAEQRHWPTPATACIQG
jgi:hypothetical protein